MPIEIRWLRPNHILISRWYGQVTCQDMLILTEELMRILDNAQGLVHTLLDMSEAESYEEGMAELYVNSPVAQHANRGRLAVVCMPQNLWPMVEKANRLAGRTILPLFDDYQMAQQFLLSNEAPPTRPSHS